MRAVCPKLERLDGRKVVAFEMLKTLCRVSEGVCKMERWGGGRTLKEETAEGSKAVKRMTSQEGKDMMTGNLEDGKTKFKMRF